MVRKFASGSVIRCSLGASAVTEAVSFAAIAKLEDVVTGCFISAVDSGGSSAGSFYDFQIESSEIEIYRGGPSRAISTSGLGGVWCLFAANKAAGTVPARLHLYRFDTKVWTHQTSGATIANAVANAGGKIQLGRWNAGEQLLGSYAAGAIWNKVLSDAEFESLAAAAAIPDWLKTGPVGMWMFNQASVEEPVTDLTGNGANQVAREGTTVVGEEPPIPYAATGRAPSSLLLKGAGR